MSRDRQEAIEIARRIVRSAPKQGRHPTRSAKYISSAFCPSCGRPYPTDIAWDELEGGQGTNLCWGNCEDADAVQLDVHEAIILAKALLSLAAEGVSQ